MTEIGRNSSDDEEVQNKIALDFLFGKAQDLLSSHNTGVWRNEPPMPFEEFVTDLKIKLTERQLQDSIAFLGKDPSMTFDNGSPFTTFCLLAGKGSGKDFLGAVIICYLFYILLCMKDPREYFQFPPTEAIDLLVISFTADQAKDVSFDKIKQLMYNWFWLKSNFTLLEGDKILNQKGRPEIYILADRIKTWNNIRIIAEHSANESYEGYNILAWVMSESSAFTNKGKKHNGWKIFNTLRSSSNSRFRNRWKGLIYSFPRYDQQVDFTWQLYEKAESDPTVFRDICYPWQFKPAYFFPSNKWFDFEGIPVPIEYQGEALADKAFFRMAVLCQVPKGGERVVSDEVILQAIHRHPPLIEMTNYIHVNDQNEKKIRAEFVGLDKQTSFLHEYLITVDLGEVYAATAVAIQHFQPGVGYILDAVGAWTPILKDDNNPEDIGVDMVDVRDQLIHICKSIPSCSIGFDQWQSRLYIGELKALGIKTVKYSVRQPRDYNIFKKAMAFKVAYLLDDPEAVRQWKGILVEGDKIVLDQKITRRKDMVDAMVGGYNVLTGGEDPTPDIPGAIRIANNLNSFGGTMIPG